MRQATGWARYWQLLGMGSLLVLLALWPYGPVHAEGIAVLKSHDLEPFNQALAGFIAACSTTVSEYDLRGSKKDESSIIQRLTAAKPNLVVAIGPLAAQVAKERVRDIPTLFVMVSNPPKYGLRGEKIAGVSLDIPVETQLTMYKALMPRVHTLGVIFDPEKTGVMVQEAHRIAHTFNVQILSVQVASQKEVPAALRSLLGKIDALWMLPDDTVITPDSFKFLLLAAFENNLPFMAVSDIFVEAGALASLSPDYTDVGRQGCQLATEMAKGRSGMFDVRVVPPNKVNLAINLKTANKIGLTLAPEIVQAASKVYR